MGSEHGLQKEQLVQQFWALLMNVLGALGIVNWLLGVFGERGVLLLPGKETWTSSKEL